ncbi:Uncharacterised protein [Raoultella terrigena]|uniref:Uncharacterized protein n=1 Tax=Raoultella terrigena TaxID=577 RepID=A0A4U9D8I4_RAOTE|nr:Uncharacterised protein [Raoultella terrigena]
MSRLSEWDLKDWMWTVPKEHSKGGNKILRPIPDVLRLFVKELIEQNRDTGLLLGCIKKPEAVSQWGRGSINVWAIQSRGRFTTCAGRSLPL